MKMVDKLKIVITSSSLSSNIQGVTFNVLATMISTLAKLGNTSSALNGTTLIVMVKATFSYITKIFEEKLLFNEGNGISVGKSYEESSKMNGIVSAVEVGHFLGMPALIEDIVWIKPLTDDFYAAIDNLE